VVFLERWVRGLASDFPAQVRQEYLVLIDGLRLKIN
jgi:hypothetical protein